MVRSRSWNDFIKLNTVVLLALVSIGCIKPQNEPADSDHPLWEVHWSYSTGNVLISGNNSSTSAWSAALKDETNYNFKLFGITQSQVPSDASISWHDDNTLVATTGNFLRQFYTNAGINSFDADHGSLMFGINTPAETQATDYAATLPKGTIPNVYGIALTLVFKSKIHSISGLTDDDKWRLTQYIVIHELGHARGLGASDDHTNHAGSNADICVMKVGISSSIPANHVFCGFHKKVLRDCLKKIEYSYDPHNQCASF